MKRVMTLVALAGMLVTGPSTRGDDAGVTVVRPGGIDVIKATVFGGQWAEVGVMGDGDTDLDLYVYDPVGRLVGYDDDETDDCLVRFYARMTGTYKIKVVNRSDYRSNAYIIAIR
jgi:hypothetical protein